MLAFAFWEIKKPCRQAEAKRTQHHWTSFATNAKGTLLRARYKANIRKKKITNGKCGSDCKESACNARDQGLIPGWGRLPKVGNDNPLEYSCLESQGGTWQATVHGISNSQAWLSN